MSRPTSELAHLFRALKAPAAARALPKLADRAREEQWSYEQFAATLPATEWVATLANAQRHGRLDDELDKLQRVALLIVDEVGYIPFDPHAANLMFMLVSRRYERASLIVTSNKPFSAWGEIFGDEVTATAMIERLVHHAEILSLKGDSYRLKDRDLARPPAPSE